MRRAVALAAALRARRWRDVADVAGAQAALLRAHLMLWGRAPGHFVEPDDGELRSPTPADRELCERLGRAVLRASRHGVLRSTCLTRAVALSNLLRANGVRGHRIRIGVRRDGTRFDAHAWVDIGGWVIGDTPGNTSVYTPLTDVRVTGQ